MPNKSKIKITYNMKNIERVHKNILNIKNALVAGADTTIGMMRDNWEKGKGGDGKSLQRPRINAQYKKRKEAAKGSSIIDMQGGSYAKNDKGKRGKENKKSRVNDGHMNQHFAKINVDNRSVIIGFNSDISRKKAKGNYNIRESIFKVGKKIRKKVVEIVNNYLTRN